ncbi:MAG: hypothetical protein GX790_04990 [Syntrophomonadaceae bacterium]|nr:hypothetical protein [Syntrophomonadaceae bacterium]
MKAYLNGKEMQFKDGGYKYVFIKPYKRHQSDTIKRSNGELHIQMYDNGVQIRTLVTKNEVSTLINRDVVVDTKNHQVYILEPDTKYIQHEDGSIEILSEEVE